jgi:hypothetical protein
MHDRIDALGLEVNTCMIVRGKKLYQEWLVDQYCKVENERLNYLRFNQNKIRADLYQGLADAVHAADGDADAIVSGKCIIMPSSFTGGPRHMTQLYQDSMAIVRSMGKPDLFITITCNPKCPEILRELRPGAASTSPNTHTASNTHTWETPNDRPDLINRVFRIRLNCLQDDVLKGGVFGRVIGGIHVIEFQKRGLPHAHILLILHPEDKPRTVHDYDRMVWAQIPDAT